MPIRCSESLLFIVFIILSISSRAVADVAAETGRENVPGKEQSEATPRKPFYEDQKKGWWWYEVEPQKGEEAQADQNTTAPKRFMPSLKDYAKDELWNMHPDDFEPLLHAFLKKAVQYPTLENVREYLVVKDIARAKANVFANVSAVALQKYPELSLEREFPTSVPGNAAKIKIQASETATKIRQSREDFALIFFYAKTCEFCKAQESILQFFVDKYGWEVKYVEINEHPDYAARFDVQTVPYLMLIHRNSSDYFPVSFGVIARDEMENRIYQGIRLLSGEITPEEYSLYEYQRDSGFDPSRYGKHESF